MRSCVWFSPPHPPIAIDSSDIVRSRSRLMVGEMIYRTVSGASFCHVSRIRPDDSGIPWVTSGTQKWKGASPNFMVRARVMMMDAVGLDKFMIVHWPEYIRLIIIASIRSIEAVACVKKYLVAASVDRGLCCFVSMGITASIFISNPIQTISQWELVITIRVPRMIVVMMVVIINGFISTGRI